MSYADAWSKWFDVIEGGAAALSAKMIELANLEDANDVLDIGTGLGEPAISAARALPHGTRIRAIDSDPQMIAFARERAKSLGIQNINFEVRNAETMPLPKEGFDVILARWSLMFVQNKPRMLKRLAAALRPGGRLVAGLWCEPESVPALTLAERAIYEHFDWPLEECATRQAFCLADKKRTVKLFIDAGYANVKTALCEIVYFFDAPAGYIQYRLDVADPVWNEMRDKPDQDWDAAFRAIEHKLQRYSTVDGRCRIVSHAYCVSGLADPSHQRSN